MAESPADSGGAGARPGPPGIPPALVNDGEALEIEARGLRARGPLGTVFQGVNLLARPAGLTVVAGQGGTGRTSLLLALGGRFRTSGGTVTARLGDTPVDPLRHSALARATPGVDLVPQWTAHEHRAERAATTRTFSTAALEAAGELLDCAPQARTVVGRLPARDRLLFAVALAVAERRPAVLVDDVDAGLGGTDLREVWLRLARLAEAGITVLATAAAPPPPDWAVPVAAYTTLSPRTAAADVARRP
ncbi:ABC transporter ATP-binding protein [Streptomyces sp. NPDC088923]|uniref:ATP-binding cassette domain-containing protein n=1 Tax=Streptomyces sp. NPDC088923 TaxID=3365913 RepID=UPI0038264182